MAVSKRMIRLAAAAVLSALMALAAPPSVAQIFEDAVAAYGRGDYAEAFAGFRILADQGDASAQYNLGVMYAKGEGVPQDYAEAAKWYHRAADQGDAFAQYNLGLMYEGGKGVPRDHVRAHMWFNLAAARIPAAEGDIRARTIRNRDRVARLLSPDALARAQRLAREWKPGAGAGPASPPPAAAPAPKPAPARPALTRASTGSGFRVSADGSILTNAHVVRGCAEVRVPPEAGPAAVAARDEDADLALIDGPPGAAAAFRRGRGVRPGAPIVVIGYPLRGILTAGANVSTGSVAALAGIRGNRGTIQITAPVQPGNSGGPVLDAAGNAVGVVVSRLDALRMARATGRVPQNVNFAVSASAARAFLDSEGVPYETASSNRARAPEDVAAAAKAFTVLIECWK